MFITGPPNGPASIVLHAVVCRRRLPSVVVCNARDRSAAAGPGAWPVRRPTLHGGTVRAVAVFQSRSKYQKTRMNV